jgi:hypothetical protein
MQSISYKASLPLLKEYIPVLDVIRYEWLLFLVEMGLTSEMTIDHEK